MVEKLIKKWCYYNIRYVHNVLYIDDIIDVNDLIDIRNYASRMNLDNIIVDGENENGLNKKKQIEKEQTEKQMLNEVLNESRINS